MILVTQSFFLMEWNDVPKNNFMIKGSLKINKQKIKTEKTLIKRTNRETALKSTESQSEYYSM